MRAATAVTSMAALLAIACSDDGVDTRGSCPADLVPDERVEARLRIDARAPVATVDPRFLSFAVDTSQVVNGNWWSPDADVVEIGTGSFRPGEFDFERPRLRRMTRELAPALLRIGGSEADKVFYELSGAPAGEPPAPYEHTFTRGMWTGMQEFARDVGLDLFFTLNAGPGPRDPGTKRWTPDNARLLVAHAVAQDAPVAVWELGNEINGFILQHGLGWIVGPAAYAEDMRLARELVDTLDPDALLAGPSSAFQPRVGEIPPFTSDFLEAGGDLVDVVTWHFYPQHSRRCPVQTRRASIENTMNPATLAEVARFAERVERERDRNAPGAPVWLGEMGNSYCGGEPGVSDRFAGSFWWVDALGRMARRGQPVIVRQTLSGSNYGLIDDFTLEPNPDYWSAVLWKRLMGERVVELSVDSPSDRVRAYAHCTAARAPQATPGAVTVLALNLDGERGATLRIEGAGTRRRELYRLSSEALDSPTVCLNGRALGTRGDGAPPPMPARTLADDDAFELPPSSFAFLVLPEAAAPACS